MVEEKLGELKDSMDTLIKIFAEASNDLKQDTHDAVLVSEKLNKILDRLEKVEVQNEKIAKGIVAVAEMLAESKSLRQSRPAPEKRPEPKFKIPSFSQENDTPSTKSLPRHDIPEEKQEDKKSFFSFNK